jgi:hypothetical protein
MAKWKEGLVFQTCEDLYQWGKKQAALTATKTKPKGNKK